MKKNIVVNLVVFLFCLIHLTSILILKKDYEQIIIPIIHYLLIMGVTLFSIHINYKWDTEEKEFMHLFNVSIICKLLLYVLAVVILLIVVCFSNVEISVGDIFGISVFNIFDVDNENVLQFMEEYDQIFHTPVLGMLYFHRTIGGQISMAQTYLLILIAYELFTKSRIKKVNDQDIFYESDLKK